jgi:hypothetical protein
MSVCSTDDVLEHSISDADTFDACVYKKKDCDAAIKQNTVDFTLMSNLNDTLCYVSQHSDGIENAYSVTYKEHGSTKNASFNVYKNNIKFVPNPDAQIQVSHSVINNLQSFEFDSECTLPKTHIDVYATCGDDSKPTKCEYSPDARFFSDCWYTCCDEFNVNVSKTCPQHVYHLTPRSRLVLDGCAKDDSVCDSCAFIRPPDPPAPSDVIPQPRTDVVV